MSDRESREASKATRVVTGNCKDLTDRVSRNSAVATTYIIKPTDS